MSNRDQNRCGSSKPHNIFQSAVIEEAVANAVRHKNVEIARLQAELRDTLKLLATAADEAQKLAGAREELRQERLRASQEYREWKVLREKAAALYTAVFPGATACLDSFANGSTAPIDRNQARIVLAQVEACK